MNKENMDFIKNSVKDDIVLPESLSAENIEKLVSEKAVQKSRKGKIRRFVAVGVAACIAIVSIALFPYERIIPENTPTENKTEESTGNAVQNNEEFKAGMASSYDEIIRSIRAYAEEYNDRIYFYAESDVLEEGMVSSDDSFATGTGTDTAVNGSTINKGQHGETNIREEGVYEEDIFITDGEYIYFTDAYGKISIIKASSDGSLEKTAEIENIPYTEETKEHSYYTGLYIKDNLLIASYSSYRVDEAYVRYAVSGIEIYDVSNKNEPVKVKTVALDGSRVSSRITDNKLILITNYGITQYFSCIDDELLIPSYYDDGIKTAVACDCIYMNSAQAEAYVNIAKIDLDDLSSEPAVTSFLGNVNETYCTKNTLYIMGYEYKNFYSDTAVLVDSAVVSGGAMLSSWNSKTKITAVDITGDKTQVKCSVELEGSVLNSYSIDEYNGYLRIAMTNQEENTLVVLNERLEKAGELTGIAPGERIKSVRFMGDTAYVVTFVQTDPLFVIDLSEPTAPKIAGEVKLPGFSSYLHPAGDGYLVGVGYGGTEDGLDGSAKISLFDVRDPKNPKEVDSIVIENCDFALEPKAFVSVSENSFMIPFSVWKSINDEDFYEKGIYTGALYVSAENGKLVRNNAYIVRCMEGLSRCTFIGDKVYVYGQCSGVASFSMDSAEFISHAGALKDGYIMTAVEKTADEILG